jgi:hypothetical protein
MDSLFIPGGFRPFPDSADVYYYNGERLKLEGERKKESVSCCSLRGNSSRVSKHASIFQTDGVREWGRRIKAGRRDVGVGTGR